MADEWIMVSERDISTKVHFLSSVESGQLTQTSFEMVGDARIKVYGDNAVLTGGVVKTAHFGGQHLDADEWTSDVIVKRDGKWLCVHSYITAVYKEYKAASIPPARQIHGCSQKNRRASK